jgi:hypothetical protein
MLLEEFVERAAAEVACGNIIVGQLAERRIVGSVANGTYSLNEEGQRMRAEFEAGNDTKAKKKPAPHKPTANAGKTHDQFVAQLLQD